MLVFYLYIKRAFEVVGIRFRNMTAQISGYYGDLCVEKFVDPPNIIDFVSLEIVSEIA